MAGGVTTEPRSGLKDMSDFSAGESGWADELVANIRQIGRLAHPNLYVLDRDVTDPTTLTPAAGDAYIPATGSTGDWTGHDGEIAIWDGAAWVYYTPAIGWLCYIADEEKISAYKAAGWSAGVVL